LGIKNGDILQGVDGRSIKRPDDILALYKKLKSGSQVSLEITRRGEQKTIDYRLR
jgi:general secretion pathway protein C